MEALVISFKNDAKFSRAHRRAIRFSHFAPPLQIDKCWFFCLIGVNSFHLKYDRRIS